MVYLVPRVATVPCRLSLRLRSFRDNAPLNGKRLNRPALRVAVEHGTVWLTEEHVAGCNNQSPIPQPEKKLLRRGRGCSWTETTRT